MSTQGKNKVHQYNISFTLLQGKIHLAGVHLPARSCHGDGKKRGDLVNIMERSVLSACVKTKGKSSACKLKYRSSRRMRAPRFLWGDNFEQTTNFVAAGGLFMSEQEISTKGCAEGAKGEEREEEVSSWRRTIMCFVGGKLADVIPRPDKELYIISTRIVYCGVNYIRK
jgi:hypothetical protein